MCVTNWEYGNSLEVIDTSSQRVIGSPVVVDKMPYAIAFDPVHNRMYVTNFQSDAVSVIDTNTNTIVGSPLVVGKSPVAIAFAPPLP
jgi:YVTN family beta-propeller protein